MVTKEIHQGTEPTLYRVQHRDGTLSFVGDSKHVKKNQPLAFQNASVPIGESDLVVKLQESQLPFKGNPTNILGWGGGSVCVRVTDGSSRYAAVIRSNREPEKWDQLMHYYTRERATNKAFAPYTLPQDLVVVSGIDNQLAVVKLSPEVPGATLSEVTGDYLILNRNLMKDYIEITRMNLKRFVTTGIISDPLGQSNSDIFRNLLERYTGLFLFKSSNIVVDFEQNKLVVVDCESDDIREQPPHRKVHLLARAFGMGLNIAALELFRGLDWVRDRAFSIPTRQEKVEKVSGVDQLNEGFAEAINLFNTSGLEYRVLGSFATAAIINNAGGDYYLTPYRRDRTIRDIDILVLDKDLDKAEKLAKEFNSRRKQNPNFPEVSLSLPRVFEEDEGYPESRPAVLPMIVTRSAMDRLGNFYLVYGGENVQIPTEYLNPVFQMYGGIEFPTLEAGVLAGFYLTRMGLFKAKDIQKMASLLELTKAKIPVEFLDFSKTLRINWPGLYRNFLKRDLMYQYSGGLIRKGIFSWVKSKFSKQG